MGPDRQGYAMVASVEKTVETQFSSCDTTSCDGATLDGSQLHSLYK